MIIVYGGSGSGKSEFAENLAAEINKNNKLYYVATMENKSGEAKKRIIKHIEKRSGKGFETIEEESDIKKHLSKLKGSTVLFECLSNYLANKMFSEPLKMAPSEENINSLVNDIYEDMLILNNEVSELVIVTNNIFSDKPEDEWTDAYMKALGRLNIKLAKIGDLYEVVSGSPVHILKNSAS